MYEAKSHYKPDSVIILVSTKMMSCTSQYTRRLYLCVYILLTPTNAPIIQMISKSTVVFCFLSDNIPWRYIILNRQLSYTQAKAKFVQRETSPQGSTIVVKCPYHYIKVFKKVLHKGVRFNFLDFS